MTTRHYDRALLIIRVAVGVIFLVHGYDKLFVMGHSGVTGFFEQLRIPLPGIAAWGVALLEFVGGFALVLGVFTRALATLFVADMLGAIGFAVLPHGFAGAFGIEFLLAATSLGLALVGAGGFSVDAHLAARVSSAAPD